MKKDEIIRQPWFPAMKGANRDLIRKVGGIERVAEFLGVSVALVGNWNNWHLADLMAMPEAIRLEGELQQSVVSRAMAVLTGATVDDPAPDARRQATYPGEASALVGEFSEYLAAHGIASADNHYSTMEKRDLVAKLNDVIDQANYAKATILADGCGVAFEERGKL